MRNQKLNVIYSLIFSYEALLQYETVQKISGITFYGEIPETSPNKMFDT